MRLTIERMRTLVLLTGVLLIGVLGVFLAVSKWRNPFSRRDLPQRLGLNIQEEANGWTYSHEFRGHTLYKIHASKQVQLKRGNQVLLQLHEVKIEFYGEDGSRVDRIEGGEFEYDPALGVAKATGPVEISLMRPDVAPAVAPKTVPSNILGENGKKPLLAAAAATASRQEIHVKTSGLTFNRNTGEASTSNQVKFEVAQGTGSAIGAFYDANEGRLVLDHAVELVTRKGLQTVSLHAQHAEFERGEQVCHLVAATLNYREGEARAQLAQAFFRDDGTAVRVNAEKGFSLSTVAGGRLAAPTGSIEFDEHNEPRRGHLQDGVTIDSDSNGRRIHGSAPTMDLQFAGSGQLRSAHLERAVSITSDEQSGTGDDLLRTHRDWESPVADMTFRNTGHGKLEPSSLHGEGGVVMTATSQRGNATAVPSRMSAEDVTGLFGVDAGLTEMTGTGHASLAQTTQAGTRQTTSGNKLVVHFAALKTPERKIKSATAGATGASMQIESATVDGNVVLLQQPASKAGAPAQPGLKANAGRAVYEGASEWLHLTQSPRIADGGLELAADKIDVSQASGDAFAHGGVKATWLGNAAGNALRQGKLGGDQTMGMLGGQGPAHVIATEARMHQASGEATFEGQARLWQQANSISAPVIVLDRNRQTLVARSVNPAEPVQVVMLSAAVVSGKQTAATPSVIRLRGGDLKYSNAERKATMHSGSAGSVVASTPDATTIAHEVELTLLPPGNHAGKDGAAAQIDRMIANGHVSVSSQGRKGTGEQLVYSSETGNYVLTGTSVAPPKLTDASRGTVTGEALIFNSRDDSVNIDGGGRKTVTETTAPK